MEPSEHERDLTTHAARRRRVLTGLLAGAAIAIPGVAFAAGGDTGSSSSSAGDTPAITIQDEGGDSARPDGRDCPKDRDGSSEGTGSSGTAFGQDQL